jgi:Leucine-rich repeat (LRR) protein
MIQFKPLSEPSFLLEKKNANLLSGSDLVMNLTAEELFKIDSLQIENFLVLSIQPEYKFLFSNIQNVCLKFHHKDYDIKEIATTVKCFKKASSEISIELWNYDLDTVNASTLNDLGSALTSLSLGFNQIKSIGPFSFAPFSNLKTLSLRINKLSSLDALALAGLQNLEELDLNQNEFTLVPSGSLKCLTSLKRLFLCNNKIRALRKDSFVGMENLCELFLFGNEISFIEQNSFSGLVNLKKLSLERNKLESPIEASVFVDLVSLEELNLIENPGSSKSSPLKFSTITSLKFLWLTTQNSIK